MRSAVVVAVALAGAWLVRGPDAPDAPGAPEPVLVAHATLPRLRLPQPPPAARTPLEPVAVAAPAAEPAPDATLAAAAVAEDRLPPGMAEAVARRYFHAEAVVLELDELLPRGEGERTRERFPGWFAALAERDRLGVDFARIEPPGPGEPLPAVDHAARGDDFARVYRGFDREDLLLERWRLGRFAAAESHRALEREHASGAYTQQPLPPPSWG